MINREILNRNRLLSQSTFFTKWWIVLPLAVAVALSYRMLTSYVAPGLNLYLVLMSLPFAFFITHPANKSIRWGIWSLIAFGSYHFLGVQTLYFSGFCLYFLFCIETTFGRLSRIPAFLIFLLSPFSHYVLNIISFPLRLKLSEIAGGLLSITDQSLSVQGNLISSDSFSFTVDPACAGLNMIITSYILGLALLAYHQQKEGKEIPILRFILYLLTIGILILAANLQRIISLIFFESMPQTFSHEVIGVLSLILLVLLPLSFLVKYFIRGRSRSNLKIAKNIHPVIKHVMHVSILGFMVFYAFKGTKREPVPSQVNLQPFTTSGYEVYEERPGITTLKKEGELIYLKPCPSFFNSTHSPAICWKGSGYNFSEEQKQIIGGIEVITAKLKKDGKTLYTAWWYDNGAVQTIDQFKWRKEMLTGKRKFQLVNITCLSKGKLHKAVDQFLDEKLIHEALIFKSKVPQHAGLD